MSPLDFLKLFGSRFTGPSWLAWRAFLVALKGTTPVDDVEAQIITTCTGRTPPTEPSHEAWLICGRRAGKSIILAVLACCLACCGVYALAPGEVGVVMVLAADRRQARVIFRYIRGLLHSVPSLEALIATERQDAIELTNGLHIEIHTSNFRNVRGYTIVAALGDEICFWNADESSANPDEEVISALKPAMSTVPNALLLLASSPYARRGAAWNVYKNHFGKDGDVLVWQAATRVMNPLVKQSVVDKAMEDDEPRARAEYLAEWRSDVESCFRREALDACVTSGCFERPPQAGIRYVGFIDFAGGSGGDSATAAVAHAEQRDDQRIAVLDAVFEQKPPFKPLVVAEKMGAFFKPYGVVITTSDKWGGQFPVDEMAKHGIHVEPSAKPKSEIYAESIPKVNSGLVDLLDHPRGLAQLAALERRTARGGKDAIDHAPNGRDDVANAICGALMLVGQAPPTFDLSNHSADFGIGGSGGRWDFGRPSSGGVVPESDLFRRRR